MRADILGSLSDIGVFETAEGALPDPGPIELVKTSGGWRIDRLPNGVFLDWQQFQSTYKRNTLYFADPTGKTVVPDPRYVAVSDPDQLATELVSKLIAGPRPEMANTVRNLLGPPLRLRGPVTRADGGKTGVGRGYGGARVDLENLSTTDPHSRQLLAAQIIWTLARADINGPYVINADGAALDDRFADGWNTTDVAATDPGAADGAAAGLHALVGGSLVSLDGQRADAVPGSFGADARPDRGRAVAHRPGGGVGGDAAARRARTWRRRCGSARLGGEAVAGRRRPHPVAAQLVAGRRGLGGGRRQQRGAGDPGGRVGAAGAASRSTPRRCPPASPAPIAELQLSRDGTRAAMVIEGQVILRRRRADARRRVRADLSAPAGLRARQHRWCRCRGAPATTSSSAAPTPQHPVSYVNLDGVNSDGPSRNLLMPVDHGRGQPVDGVRRRSARRAAAVGIGRRGRISPGPTCGRSWPGGRSRCCRADFAQSGQDAACAG